MSKRPASVRLRTKLDNGEYAMENAGSLFLANFDGAVEAGAYRLRLAFDTDKKDDNGYPVRDEVIALKTASGRKVDLRNAYLNVTVWETIPAKERK